MDADSLIAGELEIRPRDRLATARGRVINLTVYELALLAELARAQGRVLTREELYELVWGGRLRANDRSIDVYVHKLRTKLAQALPDWEFIHTHFGFGYRFSPERSHLFHDLSTRR